MTAWPGLVGSHAATGSALANCEQLVNWFVELADTASGKPALYPTPGQRAFATAMSDVGTRGLYAMNARAFSVTGVGVYEIFANGTMSRYGSVAVDARVAQIVTNGIGGNQAGICSGNNFYSLNLATNVLSAAILTNEATQIGMIDGYGLAFNKALGKLRLSNLNDFVTFDPTQFAIRSNQPDNWVAMHVNGADVWMIGERTGDVWQDAGAFPFPLAPRPGATFPYGIAAPDSIATAGDSVLWLAQNADGLVGIVRARGYTPQVVPSAAFTTAISAYSTVTDAEAVTFTLGVHVFYVITFPTANVTWAYDLTTGLFCQLSTNGGRWAPRAMAYAFGQHLTGESTSSTIGALDATVGTELNGAAIVRRRVPPALPVIPGQRGFLSQFILGVEPGLGTSTGQGSDPQVMLRWSTSAGKTWGHVLTRSVGRIGEVDHRVIWTRCGSSLTSLVPEITVSDPIPYRLVWADYVGDGWAVAR